MHMRLPAALLLAASLHAAGVSSADRLRWFEEARFGIRLLGPTNHLLTFDAEQHGGGFGRGDGKANRYYITNWTRTDQSLSWTVRLNAPAHYNVAVRYEKGSGTGRYELQIDNWKAARAVSDKTQPESLGQIDLPAGVHQIHLRALEATGGELFRPLELQLM